MVDGIGTLGIMYITYNCVEIIFCLVYILNNPRSKKWIFISFFTGSYERQVKIHQAHLMLLITSGARSVERVLL